MTSWHSYPSIYNLGHKAVADLFASPVTVQEKIDGSQFSFGLIDGVLRVRSKGQEMNPAAPDKMFAAGVEVVKSLPLREGWTYRGEYLSKPKHNALAYDRVPQNHIILFDINRGEEDYLLPDDLAVEAASLGLEVVPCYGTFAAGVLTLDSFRDTLEQTSILGGQKIEGVVVKSLTLYGPDKKRLMGKYVSEAFKETHSRVWGEQAKGKANILERIVAKYKTDARWAKAVIHLRERGLIEDSPRDIPAILREIGEDLWKEEEQSIKDLLFSEFKRDIQKGVSIGMPEWYKARLLEKQFEANLVPVDA